MNSKVKPVYLALVAAAFVYFGTISESVAGPLSNYDALADYDFTFALSNGAIADSATISTTIFTHSGDGQIDPTNFFEAGVGAVPVVAVFAHVFGSGTGSSEYKGFASVGFAGPATGGQYEIDVTEVTHNTSTSANAPTPGGFASASVSLGFDIPGATLIGGPNSGLCPAGVDICYDAVGAVTATLSADVMGDAFTPGLPEPATLALLGLGLAGIGYTSRKRKQ